MSCLQVTEREQAKILLDTFDKAIASQNAPDAKLVVMANYGDMALMILRRIVKESE